MLHHRMPPPCEPETEPSPAFIAPTLFMTWVDVHGREHRHPTFSGKKAGYVFTTRAPLGTGYYLDTWPAVSAAESTGPPPPP